MDFHTRKPTSCKWLVPCATVAHEHHEKWDGSGYPRGIAGEEIHDD
jgi:HD-GYP domain-containing protein (c-di-GMP phosphodiesterase class II)